MKRVPWSFTVFAVLLLALVGAFPLQAQSGDCNDLLVDNAHIIGSTGSQNIQNLATELRAIGVDVRVRTDKEGAFPSTDYLSGAWKSKCASWRIPGSSEMKANLAVVAFMKPNAIGLFFGKDLYPALNDAKFQILGNAGKKIGENNLPGGITASLRGIKSAMESKSMKLNPVSAPTPASSVRLETTQPPPPPTDFSWLGSVMKWVLILGAIGTAIFFGYRFFVSRQGDNEKRQGAQQNAQLAKNEASDLVISTANDLPAFEVLHKDDVATVKRVQTLIAEASESFARLVRAALCDPDQDGLSETEYQNMVPKFEAITTKLNKARAIMEGRDAGPSVARPVPPQEPATPPQPPHVPSHIERPAPHHSHGHGSSASQSDPTHVVHETTVIREDSTSGVVPFLIGEELGRESARSEGPYINREYEQSEPAAPERPREVEVPHEDGASVTWNEPSPSTRY